jgi:ketosteroid isomerase-like protein
VANNAEVIRDFYAAFDRKDGEAMARAYAPDAHFRDPAFGDLTGAEAGDMWRMLTGRAQDLRVELADHEATGDGGSARWIATYTFRTGRHVRNEINAGFRFRDGRIVDHVDSFSFHRWARQALGPAGWVLGLPVVSGLVRSKARADLDRYRIERLGPQGTDSG